MAGGTDVDRLVEHLFRRESGRMVATLARILGSAHLDLAEEVVQEALIEALLRWPFGGVPDNPGAWLMRVARNRAVDVFRRRGAFREKTHDIEFMLEALDAPESRADGVVAFPNEIADDQLYLAFVCCHPEIPREAQVALTLKLVGGFSVREIAAAFLARETTISQRIVRAKKLIRDRDLPFSLPEPRELPARLAAVLEALYLLFNEGYSSHEGDALVRRELCDEAIRLAELVVSHPLTTRPPAHALLALMLFQGARLAGRQDAGGNLLLLADQDRALWDRDMIARGLRHLDLAASGPEVTSYHAEAGIAACHAGAPSFADTDWPAILSFYDLLLERDPSPVHALNRAVALGMVDGPEAGLNAAVAIAADPALKRYYLLPATLGTFHERLGRTEEARIYFEQARDLATSAPVRRFIEDKLET